MKIIQSEFGLEAVKFAEEQAQVILYNKKDFLRDRVTTKRNRSNRATT
jgi:hypothetical protein